MTGVTSRLVVVGAGIAGLAAAWSAKREGHEVTLASAGVGASALGSGAVDDVPWEELVRAADLLDGELPGAVAALAPDVDAFARDLDLWDLPAIGRPWIATVAGRVRPARGRDRALLDLGALTSAGADALVLLPRADRVGWDADAIAAALGRSSFARTRKIAFRVVDASVLRFDDERRASDAELGARHDDPARVAWLADRLREALAAAPSAAAILLGPWLGAGAPRAEALSAAVGVPCGEALVGVGSPAGRRFEAARDRMLETLGVRRVPSRVLHVAADERPGALTTTLDGGATLRSTAVVLAIGGLVAGGVIYVPPEHGARVDLAPAGKVPFELSLAADVVLSLAGSGRADIVASMHGPELDRTAWPSAGRAGALESVGVRCDRSPGEGSRAGPGLYAAGDIVAGRPRTVLEAVATGIAAGRSLTALTR